ncbi:hypothetical protein [Parasitella parasitica]|uniref:Copper-fist domain-containing protein n=1 Tax=Parasitella parasitica TaxID=35722 RepID=A0A0B7NH29_9FUNG|nr:hypothetical protein [Parasitella parasitica]
MYIKQIYNGILHSLDIENTATSHQKQHKKSCFQCPSTESLYSEEQGGSVAYSDLIQIDNQQNQSSLLPSQCTCHETATKILKPKENWSALQQQHLQEAPMALAARSRGTMIEENGLGPYSFQKSHSSSSLRFLDGKTKSPRRRSSLTRRSSTNSGNNSRRSTISHPTSTVAGSAPVSMPFQINQQDNMMMDMQRFLLTDQFNQQQQLTEIKAESAAFTSNSLSAPTAYNVSSASSTSSSNLSSHSPNSIHADMMSSPNELGDFIMTDPDELTTMWNNVLMNNNDNAAPAAAATSGAGANNSNNSENIKRTGTSAGIDMTRSTTASSSNSQQHLQPPAMLCGSFAPHPSCSPASSIMDQGESVVITITPLSNLLSNQEQQAAVAKEKPAVTRIVTCYYGSSCICPGCFVHPNNYQTYNTNDVPPPYMQQHQQMQQQQLQQQCIMPYQLPSNNSSLCSSDDEDPSVNYYQTF